MSGIKVYVFLLFGISVMLYMFGNTSPFLALLGNVGVSESGASTSFVNIFLTSLAQTFLNPYFLVIMGAVTVSSLIIGSGGNFGVIYIAPIFILLSMANFFILPTSFINAADLDPIVKLLTMGFMNILLAMSIIEFIRGG